MKNMINENGLGVCLCFMALSLVLATLSTAVELSASQDQVPVPAKGVAKPEETIKEIPLGSRILVLQHAVWEENLTVVDAGPSLVVIDTWGSPVSAARAKTIMEQRFGKKVGMVINTHHHWDHSFGNQVFRDATIIGHRSCGEDMQRDYASPENRMRILLDPNRMPKGPLLEYARQVQADIASGFILTPPNHLVDDRTELKLGDLTLLLFHAPGLHTRSNLTIWVPELGLMITRREFAGNAQPVLESGVDLAKLIAGFGEIASGPTPLAWCIPGHGDPLQSPQLTAPLAYLRALGQAVEQTKRRNGALADAGKDPVFAALPGITEAALVHQANLALVWQEYPPAANPRS